MNGINGAALAIAFGLVVIAWIGGAMTERGKWQTDRHHRSRHGSGQ